MNQTTDSDALVPRHAEDEALLAYLDGELDDGEARRTSDHLEQCWRCRSRVNRLEASIHAFLEAREQTLPSDLASPGPMADAGFRQRLAAHAANAGMRPGVSAVLHGWRLRVWGRLTGLEMSPRLRLVTMSAALVIVVLAATATWWSVPVSAAHVLARAEVHELIDVEASDRVVHSVVDVDRIDGRTHAAARLGSIEIHADPASFAVRVGVESGAGGVVERAVLSDADAIAGRHPLAAAFPLQVARYFESRRWSPSVDAKGFLRLVAGCGDEPATARRVNGLFEVVQPFAADHPSGISEARLYVDPSTWLPVRVSLFLPGGEGSVELRFSRTTLEFLPRTDEDARAFAAARPVPFVSAGAAPAGITGGTGSAGSDLARRPLPLSWDSAPASDAEVAVADVLHDLGADLGEEINVFPMSDGSLLVQGLVDNADRRRQIEQGLHRVAEPLRTEIHVPADMRGGPELFAAPWRAPESSVSTLGTAPRVPVIVADAGGRGMPAQRPLEDHIRQALTVSGTTPTPETVRQAVSAFSNRVVAQSRDALFHAWALYRLDQQFQPDRAGSLSAQANATVTRIRQAHRTAIARLARELSTSLAPVAGAPVATLALGPGDTTSAALLRSVADADALTRSLFTVSNAPVDTSASLARLSALLRRVGAQAVPLS